jgi:hypothetical protein
MPASKTEFVPGLAGGDVFGGACGEPGGVRGNPDSPQIEAVGIEADGEGGLGLGWSAVVDAAGGDEEFHPRFVEMEVTGLAEFDGETGTARPVVGIGVFVVAAGVVEEGEEADDLLIGGMVAAEFDAVAQDGQPMERPMDGGHREAELINNALPERDLNGEQEREV